MNYSFFLMLRALPAWLRLSREERRHLADAHLGGALRASPGVRLRHFDAEAFSAPCSDLMLVECADPRNHYCFMERLRDTALLHEPYFEIMQIIPAIEDGYRAYESA